MGRRREKVKEVEGHRCIRERRNGWEESGRWDERRRWRKESGMDGRRVWKEVGNEEGA